MSSGWDLAVGLGAGVPRGLGVPVCGQMVSLGDLWCSFFRCKNELHPNELLLFLP